MDKVRSKISLFSELTVSSDEREGDVAEEESDDVTEGSDDVITRPIMTAGPVQAWTAEGGNRKCLRIPCSKEVGRSGKKGGKKTGGGGKSGTSGNCESKQAPLIVRLSKQLPQPMIDRNRAQEKAIVLKEKRKRESISRRKEEIALERKLKFQPRYIHITPPPKPKPKPTKPETQLIIKTPLSPRRSTDSSLDFSSLMNVKSLSSAETGISQEDLDSFVRQSQLARDMLKINFRENKLSIVFDEKADKCENLLRKEIQRHKTRKNPTFCIIK